MSGQNMYKEKTIELVKDKETGSFYLIDDRYSIYLSDGCIYDKETQEIPQEVFELRDVLLKLAGIK